MYSGNIMDSGKLTSRDIIQTFKLTAAVKTEL